MDAADFISAPENLLPATLMYGRHFENAGYSVKIEPFDVAYPRTPFFLVKRSHTSIFIEVHSKLRISEVRGWVSYGRGCQRDTRVIVALTKGSAVTGEEMDQLKSIGAGLWMIGGNGPYEVLASQDLALKIDLPELPRGLKRLLGDAYDQFGRGEWREGFETAGIVFEQQARAYLKLHMNRGRVLLQDRGGKAIKLERIDKLTMGQLAVAFQGIQSPNVADTRIGQALERINDERVTVAHYKGKGAAREDKLRANVASHMFVVVGGLRQIKGIKS